jgi:platelet-activating factor acetylhydrolase IB subunit alpha
VTNGDDDQRYKGLLEKKWTSVIRLQKKVNSRSPLFPNISNYPQIMDLEARLHALQTELDSAPSSMRQKSLDPATWIPRSPARHNLSGHRMPVSGLAFHPTFTVVASSSEDSTIKIWDWETGEFEQTIKGHTKSVHDVDFSFDGKLLST